MSKQAGRFSADGQDQHIAPLAVTGLTATDVGTAMVYNNGAANLAWTLPTNSLAATLYTVTSTPATTTQTTSSTSYQFTGLASNTAYTFTVVPSNSYGSGPSTTSGSITATTVPQAPTIGTATDTGSGRAYNNGLATVTFTANATGGKAITSYAVNTFDTIGNYLLQITGTGSPLQQASLASATQYQFAAYAYNANGYSAASSFSNTITATTVPAQMSAPSATATTNADNIGYTAPANGGSAILDYTIVDSVPQTVTGVTANPYTFAEAAGQARTFTIAARNTNGTGVQSASSGSATALAPAFFAPPGFFSPPGFFAPPGFFSPPGFFHPPGFFSPPGFFAPPGFFIPPRFFAPPAF